MTPRKSIIQIYSRFVNLLAHTLLQERLKKSPSRPRRKRAQRADNKRTAVSPELRQYLRKLQKSNASAKLKRDFEELAHYSYMFDLNFYKKQLDKNEACQLESTGDIIRHYCEHGWKHGLDPCILFETKNHLLKYPTRKKRALNPLIHFLSLKNKEFNMAIDNDKFMRKTANIKKLHENPPPKENERLQSAKIGVFLHIFYIEKAEIIAKKIENIPFKISAHITTRQEIAEQVKEIFSRVQNARHIEIRCPENRGRDIAPFFIEFKHQIPDYDFILKMHTKKSPHSKDLEDWFLHCLTNLVGSRTIVETNLNALLSADTGLVYPTKTYTIHLGIQRDSSWGANKKNYQKASAFLKKCNLITPQNSLFDFPAGSMFWCKPEVLKPILELNLSLRDFDKEKGQTDGTMAHAIERMIGIATTDVAKLKILTTYCSHTLLEQ